MFDRMRKYLAPPMFENEEKTRSAGLLNVVLLTMLALTAVYAFLAPFTQENPVPLLAINAILAPLWLGGLYLIRRGWVRPVAFALAAIMWVLVTFTSVVTGGVRSPGLVNYVMAILIAGLILGGRAGIGVAAAAILVSLGMLYAELSGFLPFPRFTSTPVFTWVVLAGNFVVTAVLLHLATRSIDDALGRAHRNERALAERNRELQARTRELEAEIAGRKRVEGALRESEERLRSIVEQSSDGIVLTDERGAIIEWNRGQEQITGLKRADVLGRPLWDVQFQVSSRERDTPAVYEQVKASILEFLETGQAPWLNRLQETVILRSDGTRRSVQAIIFPIKTDRGFMVGGISRDITDLKRAGAERERLVAALERRSIQLQTAAEVSKSASTILNPEELINQAVNLIQERFGFYYVGLFLVDEPGEYAVLRAGTGEAGQQMVEAGHKLRVGGDSMIGWCTARGQARIALDVGKEAIRFDNPLLPQTRSEMALPLLSRGRCIGALTVQSDEEAAFSEEDIVVLGTMADHLAIAIENARFYDDAQREIAERKRAEKALQERAARLELIARVGHRTTATLDLDALLHQAVNLIGDAFEYHNVVILLVEDEEIVLRAATLPAARSSLEGRARLRIGVEGITGWVAGSGEPLLVPDVSLEPRYRAMLERPEVKSELAVPIKLKDIVVGVLDVQSAEKAAFSEEDIVVLQTLADQLSIAIENARLYERLRDHAAELEQRVAERTVELAAVNKELEAFAYSVSHDLRAPLRSIDGFSRALLEDYEDRLDAEGQDYLHRVRASCQRMGQLIDDLLRLSRVTRGEMRREPVDLSALAQEIAVELQETQPERRVEFIIQPGLAADGDARLLRVVLENLLGNAWKFTGKRRQARIEFGLTEAEGRSVYFVSDNGAGFDMAYADRLFGAFQRLHSLAEFRGTGIGLATVQRVIHRHGGHVWAEGAVGQGATFYFTLGTRMGEINGEQDHLAGGRQS